MSVLQDVSIHLNCSKCAFQHFSCWNMFVCWRHLKRFPGAKIRLCILVFSQHREKNDKLPSGNLTVCDGKSQFLMGRRTINGHFPPFSIVNCQRIRGETSVCLWFSYGFRSRLSDTGWPQVGRRCIWRRPTAWKRSVDSATVAVSEAEISWEEYVYWEQKYDYSLIIFVCISI